VSTTPVFQAFRGYGYITNPTINPANGAKGTDNENFVVIGPGTNKSQTEQLRRTSPGRLADPALERREPDPDYGLRLETQSMENLTFDSPGFEINDQLVAARRGRSGTSPGPAAQGRRELGPLLLRDALTWEPRLSAARLQINYTSNAGQLRLHVRHHSAGSFDTTPSATTQAARHPPREPGRLRQTGGGLTPATRSCRCLRRPVRPEVQYEVVADVAVGSPTSGGGQGMVIEDMSRTTAPTTHRHPGWTANIYYPDGSLRR